MKNSMQNHILVPKPEIRFDGKAQLKRRTSFGAIAWASSAVAAMLIVGGIFYFEGSQDEVFVAELVCVVDSVAQVAELTDNKSVNKIKNDSVIAIPKATQSTVKRVNKVTTPPPVKQQQKLDTKLQKTIESELKREKLPQISISPKTVLATVTKSDLEIEINTQNAITESVTRVDSEQVAQIFIVNSNLNRFIESVKSDIESHKENSKEARNENRIKLELNSNLKQLFEPKKRSETLISKTEE